MSGAGGLARDGSVLHGVGMGFGRRTAGQVGAYPQVGHPNPYSGQGGGYGYNNDSLRRPTRSPSVTSGMTAGNAGLGAGGLGVDRLEPQGYGGNYYGSQEHNCEL